MQQNYILYKSISLKQDNTDGHSMHEQCLLLWLCTDARKPTSMAMSVWCAFLFSSCCQTCLNVQAFVRPRSFDDDSFQMEIHHPVLFHFLSYLFSQHLKKPPASSSVYPASSSVHPPVRSSFCFFSSLLFFSFLFSLFTS